MQKFKYRCTICGTKFMLKEGYKYTPEDQCPGCSHLTKSYPINWVKYNKEM